MDPVIRSLLGRVQASEHSVRNTHGDTNVRPRKSLKDSRVCIKELDFVDVVGLQELHHLRGWQRVGSHGTPVHTHSLSHNGHAANGEGGEHDEEARNGGHFWDSRDNVCCGWMVSVFRILRMLEKEEEEGFELVATLVGAF